MAMEEEEIKTPKAIQIDSSWMDVLHIDFSSEYFQKIRSFLKTEKQLLKIIYPPGQLIFNAYNLTPFDNVKVVILGQDPYHGPGQAHGLCFSVQKGIKPPPSLVNIFKEIKSDLNIDASTDGNGSLENWAKQGVFLLNAMLTVEKDKPASHQQIGWQNFTDSTIKHLNDKKEHLVFMLWGNYAQQKAAMIDPGKHLILQSPHPSPFSADRGFFGNKHFSKANAYLKANGIEPINWKLN
ncbi:MAG: uracil-DNA glycosylase [Chitinophagales bacterium]